MGYTRKLTKAELRQRAQNQEASAYLEWLSGMDAGLAMFFAEDAPEVAALPDPWTRDGLRLAVLAARRAFADHKAIYVPEHKSRADRFIRFYGELYRRTFEGHWENVPENAYREVELHPVVAGPPCIGFMDPEAQLAQSFVTMINKRTPAHPDGQPAWVFDNWTRAYARWIEVGRPDYEEWQKILMQDMLDGRI